jgi:hypothetical protein
MKIIVLGAGEYGNKYISELSNNYEIVAVADNYDHSPYFMGHKVIPTEKISHCNYDYIVMALRDETEEHFKVIKSVYDQLKTLGVPEEKIILQNLRSMNIAHRARTVFLKNIAADINKLQGNVAECGVFRGEFAGVLSENFPAKKLYLFDTFSGFEKSDIEAENGKETIDWLNSGQLEQHKLGSEFITLLRCPHKENCEIRKGYVPDTFAGLEDEEYCFVNLDMDLYLPTLSALKYFAPRITSGGVILLHDYYYLKLPLPGIKKAVDESEQYLTDFISMPIGDGFSLALKRK